MVTVALLFVSYTNDYLAEEGCEESRSYVDACAFEIAFLLSISTCAWRFL